MTLRVRLLLVLLGVVVAGLLVADSVTYNQLDSFLYARTDQQLDSSSQVVGDTLSRCLAISPFGGGAQCYQYLRLPPGTILPVGTYGELLDANGGTVLILDFGVGQGNGAAPSLPGDLPGSSSGQGTLVYFSASSPGADSVHYRVLAEPVEGGGTLVVAFPTTDIAGTLARLERIEALVTIAVMLSLGAMAWWIVQRGLRPLDEMTETAGAIAQGDLSRRVPDDGGRTEVGRLGVALNAMLANIEQAFDARSASEERLRRFLADASHELRTPLTSIRGYAEMFDRGVRDSPEDLATSMRHIRTEADRMSELVNDLLLLARLDRERPLEHARLDLVGVVSAAVDAARVSSPGRPFSFSVAGPVPVEGDAARLRQVADNLLTNAVRHTPAGTPVEVGVRTDDGTAVLEVRDHGPGVPVEEQQHIFEPFHRADSSRNRSTGGVGLGLAIVSAITRAHGGTAGVQSNGTGGATFWVRLPLAESVASPASSEPPVESDSAESDSADSDSAEPDSAVPGRPQPDAAEAPTSG